MLEKWAGLTKEDGSIFSEKEEKFKQITQEKYGFSVRQTLWEKGAMAQVHLRVWATFDALSEHQNSIRSVAIETRYDCFSDSDKTPDEFRIMANTIFEDYVTQFNIDHESFAEGFLYLYDYEYTLKCYAYSSAQPAIREMISQQYSIPAHRVNTTFGPEIAILVDNSLERFRVRMGLSQIKKLSYCEINKHDDFGIIDENDINVKIISRSDITPQQWHNYCLGK